MMLKPFIALFICLNVAACGGGGGSSSPAPVAGGGTGSGSGSGSTRAGQRRKYNSSRRSLTVITTGMTS
jgi:hypothetical protein